MITEEDKRTSEIFMASGFGLMGFLGKVILDIPGFKLYPVNFLYLLFILISIISFYFGMILILKSIERVT